MSGRPLILVSNDDGVHAPGNVALREAIAHWADVVTVAPEREMSAGSHSITLHRPLRHRQVSEFVHAIDGTPADCVFVALFHDRILPRKPDLVLSGINHGPNLGSDIYYSGTVAAAREGALRGIPSIAFSSLSESGDFKHAAEFASAMARRTTEAPLPSDQTLLLNVNLPEAEPKGVRVTRLGTRKYAEELMVRRDPRGREYFWLGGSGVSHELVEGADTEAVDDGYVSVTPLRLRITRPEHLEVAAHIAGIAAQGSNA